MSFLPIAVETWIEDALDSMIVEGRMQRSFGPWVEGTRHILTFNFDRGTVTEFGDDGEIIHAVTLSLVIEQ